MIPFDTLLVFGDSWSSICGSNGIVLPAWNHCGAWSTFTSPVSIIEENLPLGRGPTWTQYLTNCHTRQNPVDCHPRLLNLAISGATSGFNATTSVLGAQYAQIEKVEIKGRVLVTQLIGINDIIEFNTTRHSSPEIVELAKMTAGRTLEMMRTLEVYDPDYLFLDVPNLDLTPFYASGEYTSWHVQWNDNFKSIIKSSLSSTRQASRVRFFNTTDFVLRNTKNDGLCNSICVNSWCQCPYSWWDEGHLSTTSHAKLAVEIESLFESSLSGTSSSQSESVDETGTPISPLTPSVPTMRRINERVGGRWGLVLMMIGVVYLLLCFINS